MFGLDDLKDPFQSKILLLLCLTDFVPWVFFLWAHQCYRNCYLIFSSQPTAWFVLGYWSELVKGVAQRHRSQHEIRTGGGRVAWGGEGRWENHSVAPRCWQWVVRLAQPSSWDCTLKLLLWMFSLKSFPCSFHCSYQTIFFFFFSVILNSVLIPCTSTTRKRHQEMPCKVSVVKH